MAKFCENCGNPIKEGSAFCDNCGTRLASVPTEGPIHQQTAQPIAQQVQDNVPNVYSQSPQPPKKKNTGLIIGIVALLIAVAAVIIFVVLPMFKSQPTAHKKIKWVTKPTVSTTTSTETALQDPTESIVESTVIADSSSEPATESLPDFEKYGIVTDIKQGETFDVITQIKGSDDIIIGKGKLDSYTREPVSQEIVDFMKDNGEDVKGYEVLRVSFSIEYSKSLFDSESKAFKGHLIRIISDYYNIDLFDDTAETKKDSEGENYFCRDVICNGETKNICFWLNESANLENDKIYYHDDRTFLVPAGYDGIVCGYRDVRLNNARIHKNYSEESYCFVRLTDKTDKSTNDNDKLPYTDSLGDPIDTDFAWIADAQSGSLSGTKLTKDDFIGKWKAEIIFDGAFELATISISKDAIVTVTPYKINSGDGWKDKTGESVHILNGEFDHGGTGNVFAIGSYGNLDLYQFTQSNGTQYGLGTLSLPSGENVNVYLVRK